MKKKLLLGISFLFVSSLAVAQWSALGSGFDGDVNAVCVFNNTLYAAGNFTHDGSSSTSLSHIAQWNGTTWVSVGGGFDATVTSMAVLNSELYVGGDFTTAGGNPASRIAKWNGSTWSSVDSGFNNTVRCLYVSNGVLYAGGTFTMSGTTPLSRIARLSGTEWQAIGTAGPVGPVNAIVYYNNELYIGGDWSPPAVSKFNPGTDTWNALPGTGPDNEVTSLAVFRKQLPSNVVLWIGGKFNSPSPRLCTWTSSGGFATSFNSFNSTTGNNVNALFATSDYLFAGGGFTATVSGNSISKLGKYDGASHWDSVGAVPDNEINAFASFNGNLVIGGKFTSLGAVSANRIAMRSYTIGIEENETNVTVDFFPNPLVDHSILRIETKSSIHQPELKMLDLFGREVNPAARIVAFTPFSHEIEYRVEKSGLPAGIYFYWLSDQGKNIATGKFIVD